MRGAAVVENGGAAHMEDIEEDDDTAAGVVVLKSSRKGSVKLLDGAAMGGAAVCVLAGESNIPNGFNIFAFAACPPNSYSSTPPAPPPCPAPLEA